MSDKEYPCVRITKGDYTLRHYRYMVRLWMHPEKGLTKDGLRYADTLWGARRIGKRMLKRYMQGQLDNQFKEEIRL